VKVQANPTVAADAPLTEAEIAELRALLAPSLEQLDEATLFEVARGAVRLLREVQRLRSLEHVRSRCDGYCGSSFGAGCDAADKVALRAEVQRLREERDRAEVQLSESNDRRVELGRENTRLRARFEEAIGERNAAEAERDRLMGLFDAVGMGEYNVLALVDHWSEEHGAMMAEGHRLAAENERLRKAVDGFVQEVESAERHFERPRGGMQVPFFGDFVGAERIPSLRSRLAWWARHLKAALAGPGPGEGEA
jgi:hypothetical protein